MEPLSLVSCRTCAAPSAARSQMNLWPVKNRRLSAVLLLAAFALLQVRVAFAACEMAPQNSVESVAACCVDHDSTMGMQPVDQMAPACVGVTCAGQMSMPQADLSALRNPQTPSFAHSPRSAAVVELTFDAPLRVSVSQAHPAHTSLIYVLQRLII